MICINLQSFNEGTMPTPKTAAFNYNKLQAVACMAASAAVSIALIVWACKSWL
jgi:hypothetical protein